MNLRNFAEIIEADEVLLFERATFLVRTFCSADRLHTCLLLFSNGEQHIATFRKNLLSSCHYVSVHSLIYKVVLSVSDLKDGLWFVALEYLVKLRYALLHSWDYFCKLLFICVELSLFPIEFYYEMRVISLLRKLVFTSFSKILSWKLFNREEVLYS